MTIKPVKVPVSVSVSASTSSSVSLPYGFWPSAAMLANFALVLFGAWLFSGHLAPLLLAALAGAAIGWLRRAGRMRSRFGESFVSALFGAGWSRENAALVVVDILSRALVGYFVGIAFGSFAATAPWFGGGLPALLAAGGAGGGGAGGPGWEGLLLIVYLFLVASALLGAAAMLLGEGAVRSFLYSAHFSLPQLAADAASGASKSVVRAAAKAVVEDRKAPGLGASALKGSLSGVLVGLVLLLLGLR